MNTFALDLANYFNGQKMTKTDLTSNQKTVILQLQSTTEVNMTQLTIAQWLSHNTQSEVNMTLPRYQIVASNRFYGHFDVLDVRTGKREPCGNLRTARATLKDLQSK